MTTAHTRREHRRPYSRAPLCVAEARSPERCARSLAAYLRSVQDELALREVTVVGARVQSPGPQQALCASIELRSPGMDPNRTIRAGWHEELGWWAQPGSPSAGSVRARRYLPGELAPGCAEVADFLTHSVELGTVEPSLRRYRLVGTDDELITALTQQVTGGSQ
ncbi:DUF6292 family protein [Pseudonocardia spinosispora]|uniref:DUF6292 family protein n=1 Tax=Pseudonocardia spinosispora TaxID=103441 RepID=UPI0012EBFBBE|nr:DUF6292 family protein [Pseudonocardia spinosispora]